MTNEGESRGEEPWEHSPDFPKPATCNLHVSKESPTCLCVQSNTPNQTIFLSLSLYINIIIKQTLGNLIKKSKLLIRENRRG